jgi:hypothetical protein
MPLNSPAAIAGAAPITTTRVMALSLRCSSRMANGSHAMEGIDCRPTRSDPTARRASSIRAMRIATMLAAAAAMT